MRNQILALALLLFLNLTLNLIPISLYANKTPALNSFTTDGCSKSPDGTVYNPKKWLKCCVIHDVWYWIGGTAQERKNADLDLYQCIKDKGELDIATLYYWAVRTFGGPGKIYASWGYGWNIKLPYRPLTAPEIELRESVMAEVIATNRSNFREFYIEHFKEQN